MKVACVMRDSSEGSILVDVYDSYKAASDYLKFLSKEYFNSMVNNMRMDPEVAKVKTDYYLSFYHVKEYEVMQ